MVALYVDQDGDEAPAVALQWQPFVGFGAHFVANLLEAGVGLARAVAVEFFAAANHAEQQETFMRQAALEIESLASGVVPLFAPVRVPNEDDLEDDDDEWDEDED